MNQNKNGDLSLWKMYYLETKLKTTKVDRSAKNEMTLS
ncbi:hypothetical protein BC643_2159 [Mangrovibacterium diazotrophicum]|uniref:Uncharacterized protein n=1 Tax=Mangrovibacterium diazotrophicum TaxID=1261403 RepID=A0A419W8I7_9BACT|nr:hypothetical protein BC643_2159 [Mangrovibacterium diazotrophicum]